MSIEYGSTLISMCHVPCEYGHRHGHGHGYGHTRRTHHTSIQCHCGVYYMDGCCRLHPSRTLIQFRNVVWGAVHCRRRFILFIFSRAHALTRVCVCVCMCQCAILCLNRSNLCQSTVYLIAERIFHHFFQLFFFFFFEIVFVVFLAAKYMPDFIRFDQRGSHQWLRKHRINPPATNAIWKYAYLLFISSHPPCKEFYAVQWPSLQQRQWRQRRQRRQRRRHTNTQCTSDKKYC